MRKRDDELYERVMEMTKAGKTVKQIAAETGKTEEQIQWRVRSAQENGDLKSAKSYRERSRRPDTIFARIREKTGVKLGKFSDIANLLTMDEITWLFTGAPNGTTVAEFIAAIIKDSYAEENEK